MNTDINNIDFAIIVIFAAASIILCLLAAMHKSDKRFSKALERSTEEYKKKREKFSDLRNGELVIFKEYVCVVENNNYLNETLIISNRNQKLEVEYRNPHLSLYNERKENF